MSRESGRKVLRIAVAQMCSSNDAEKNFKVCASLVRRAAAMNAELLCLPENAPFLGASMQESQAFAEPLDSKLLDRYKELAVANKLWISVSGWKESPPKGVTE